MDYQRILYSEISFKPASTTTTTTIQNNYHATNNIHNHSNSHHYNLNSNNINSNKNHISSNHNNNNNNNSTNSSSNQEEFQLPKHQLCDPNVIRLDWVQSEKVGGGLINVGNTCFLNSVLQCLTYCPPLYNFLVKLNGGHSSTCKINQFCMLCEMEKHVKRIRASNSSAIKPISIVQRLKYINKSFQFGRQEDAHEFLRYIIDHMWKACLVNHDISLKASSKLDPKIKETTVINHIFGGYHRSQVLCLTCNSRSNTFDFFMDFILDIRNAKSLEEALKRFTQPETLEHENAYKCGKCRKKVTAKKKFTVYKAPNVATFQLKRFDSDRIFGGKVTKFISYPEELDLRPYMSDTTKPSIKYQLSAVLVHVGHSSNSGHYFCFIKNSDNFWYRMDDSTVSLVSQNTVLQQQAYVLFYNRKTPNLKDPSVSLVTQNNHNVIQQHHALLYNKKKSDLKHPSSVVAQESKNSSISSTAINNNNSSSNGTNNSTSSSSSSNINNNSYSNGNGIANTNGSTSTTNNSNNQNHINNNNTSNTISNNNNTINKNTTNTSFTTWFGARSKLEDEDSNKRKLNEISDRDKFNDELDQGKTKKIKSRNRDDRFSNLSKSNPFQRLSSNGYQQYNNNKRDSFQKHNGRQYKNSHDSHKNRFRHNGKHKGHNFNNRR